MNPDNPAARDPRDHKPSIGSDTRVSEKKRLEEDFSPRLMNHIRVFGPKNHIKSNRLIHVCLTSLKPETISN